MSSLDRFEQALGAKIATQPDRSFDQRFWAKFDLEFGGAPRQARSRVVLFRWASAFAAVLVVALTFELARKRDATEALLPGGDASLMAVAELEESDVELLAELDEIPQSEEEWAVLEGKTIDGASDES